MSDCVGKQSRNPSPIADNRFDCPIDPYHESCNNTQSSQAERGMGYNPPEKNEQPAASPVLRSDFNLHETRNGLPRAVGDSMMSPIAQFPQDPRVLMENSVSTPSFSSPNTPTSGAKWPTDLRHEPPTSEAGLMNTPSVVMGPNPVYGGVTEPYSSPFMTRNPQESGHFQDPNWRFYDPTQDGNTHPTFDQPPGVSRPPQPPQCAPNAAPNTGDDGMPNGFHHPPSATSPTDNFRAGGFQAHLATNTANTLLRASHDGGDHAAHAEETSTAMPPY